MDFQLQQLEKYNDDRGQLIVFFTTQRIKQKNQRVRPNIFCDL